MKTTPEPCSQLARIEAEAAWGPPGRCEPTSGRRWSRQRRHRRTWTCRCPAGPPAPPPPACGRAPPPLPPRPRLGLGTEVAGMNWSRHRRDSSGKMEEESFVRSAAMAMESWIRGSAERRLGEEDSPCRPSRPCLTPVESDASVSNKPTNDVILISRI